MWPESNIVTFDELIRLAKIIIKNDCSQEFLKFVKHTEENRFKWAEITTECVHLKNEIDLANAKISKLEKMLNTARVSLDQERKKGLEAKYETKVLQEQVAQIHNVLSNVYLAGDELANETKEKFNKFLSLTNTKTRKRNENYEGERFDAIDEINSTGSLLSDQEYTRSEYSLDLDASLSEKGAFRKPTRSSSPIDSEVPVKKRRSARINNQSKNLITTTAIVNTPEEESEYPTYDVEVKEEFTHIQPSAPFETSSMINNENSESVKKLLSTPFSMDKWGNNEIFTRPHDFRSKTVLKPSEECGVCFKRVTFGNKISHCHDCRVSCHAECRDRVPPPCIALVDTPRGNSAKTIAHYCSKTSPMIPPLILRSVIEIEERGLNEVGIYGIPGSEKDVTSLKDRFLRGKGVCSLSDYEIHAICGTIKNFLKSLHEPLLSFKLRSEFIQISEEMDPARRIASFHRTISRLPQPNRDTLAFLIIHLLKVLKSTKCKMSKNSLAKEFGPMIVGYSNPEPDAKERDLGKKQQVKVMELFFDIPVDSWNRVMKENNEGIALVQIQTPIALRQRNRQKERKIFSTPPVK